MPGTPPSCLLPVWQPGQLLRGRRLLPDPDVIHPHGPGLAEDPGAPPYADVQEQVVRAGVVTGGVGVDQLAVVVDVVRARPAEHAIGVVAAPQHPGTMRLFFQAAEW